MTVPALRLDDLTWEDMVEAIRTRIVANSRGQWTMHGPADTGVTLLELFAYLFEQRLYWLDQVHAPLARALLALLDDAPRPTQAARTVLAYPTPADGAATAITAGTLFTTTVGEAVLPMTTLEPVQVLPVHDVQPDSPERSPRLSLLVDGSDRTSLLATRREVEILPIGGAAGSCEIVFWLDRAIEAIERGMPLTMLVELAAPKACAPEWAPRATDTLWFERVPLEGYAPPAADQSIAGTCGLAPAIRAAAPPDSDPLLGGISPQWAVRDLDVEAPAALAWAYSTGASSWRAVPEDSLVDGTGGLRRSGVVRLQIPVDWAPVGPAVSGLVPYALRISCERGTFSAPPMLTRLVPNVAVARQVQSVQMDPAVLEPQLAAWLKLPGQQLALDKYLQEPIEDSVQLELCEADGEWYRWRPTDDFYRHGPADRVFVVDRSRKALRFGNGLTGRIPVLASAAPRVRLCYLAGGGPTGNLASQQWLPSATSLAPVNAVPAIGGLAAESFAEADARMARDLQRIERAVTASDYESLALSTPGIAIVRAHAAVGLHPDFPCQLIAGATTVFVVPEVPRNADPASADLGVPTPRVDPGALLEITQRVEARRLLTHEVYVRPARYRAVFVALDLQGIVLVETALSAAIENHLRRHLDALVGGDLGDGWEFGGPLRPTALLHQVQQVLGNGVAVARVAIALDEPAEFEDCRDVAIGEHELVYLAGLTTRFDRAPVAQGGLR